MSKFKVSIVQVHKIMINELKNVFLTNKCIRVSKLAIIVNMDIRTVKRHLEIAEIDNFGCFTDENKTIFCKF